MAEFVQIKGLDQIQKRLQALPEKLRRRAVRKSLKDASELVRAEAEQRAPTRKKLIKAGWESFVERDDEPHLKDNITKKVSVTAKGASARVGVDYKKVRHGHLVEFGTGPHMVGKYHHPGARKQPFVRPAFDSKGDQAVEIMVNDLAQAVEQEI